MTNDDKDAFADLITQALAFYGQAVSPFSLNVWWQACQGVELPQVRKALTAHAMDPERGQFAPKPADIVRQLKGTQADRSLIAWGKVLDAIKRVGAYQSVVFDDGAIHAAIEDMGGWSAVCSTTDNELPFVQKRFTDAHRAYSSRSDTAFPARLLGEHELQNRQHGYASAPPVLIGDPERAARVQQIGSSGSKTTITVMDAAYGALKRIGSAA